MRLTWTNKTVFDNWGATYTFGVTEKVPFEARSTRYVITSITWFRDCWAGHTMVDLIQIVWTKTRVTFITITLVAIRLTAWKAFSAIWNEIIRRSTVKANSWWNTIDTIMDGWLTFHTFINVKIMRRHTL